MARSRDAVDTIKGYYYQFDYFIFQLISLVNVSSTLFEPRIFPDIRQS